MNPFEFKNILLSKGESMLINTGNIISENQLRAVGNRSTSDEARDSLKEALRAYFSREKCDIFSVPLETSFECRNTKRIEAISTEERPTLRITVKLFVASCDPKLVENAIETCLYEFGVPSLDAVILKTQGSHSHARAAALPIASENIYDNGGHTHIGDCRLLQCYSILERFYDEGKIGEIGITDIESLNTLEKIISHCRVKPTVNQLHKGTCETLSSELIEFAEANQIELLTHNDPEDMLSSVDASAVMSSMFLTDAERLLAVKRHQDNFSGDAGDMHVPTTVHNSGLPIIANQNWHFRWLARCACIIKCRGVIKSKGYIAHLGRDLRHLPPAAESTISSAI